MVGPSDPFLRMTIRLAKVSPMDVIAKINSESCSQENKSFAPGDTVRVHQLIREGNKERIQIFEGAVIARKGSGHTETFTVRKVSHNVGVERIFPVNSPRIKKIEIKQRGLVRRAKLYYLRDLRGKASKIREARYSQNAG